MNRIDRAVIAGLILVVALAALAIGGPAFAPTGPGPSAAPSVAAAAPYREGVIGHPTSVNPLAARTQADRDLVALVFEGLVRLDASGDPQPALASSWTSSPDGATWTFRLRADAAWHDGTPVTADDVAFTVGTLQDPGYHGPGAGSWTGVTVTAVDNSTVRFDLDPPIGGFIDLATQAIAPHHLLSATAPAAMAADPFGQAPVGSGPYAMVELTQDHAILDPASSVEHGGGPGPTPEQSIDPLATVHPTIRPTGANAALGRIELRFYDDPSTATADFRAGRLDAISGLDPTVAASLAAMPGNRLVRDPMTTLAAVAVNLRPTHPEFADPRSRSGLWLAIDRSGLVQKVYAGLAAPAVGLIPPTSWAFDATASPTVSPDLKKAVKDLADAGWVRAKDGWRLGKTAPPAQIELLVPDRSVNPTLAAVGSQVAAEWTALGFAVNVREEDPAVIAADHLRTGDFGAVVIAIAVGHDPDLYPLLASSQTRTGGANVFGLQDPVLDRLLEAAREPGALEARKAAFTALQQRLAGGTYLLPIAWPDSVVVLDSRVIGPASRPVADGSERFWDVLTWRLADVR
jgi:peptide/nickel transport system substrate-binding protein